jgi:hypothetical protein
VGTTVIASALGNGLPVSRHGHRAVGDRPFAQREADSRQPIAGGLIVSRLPRASGR